MRVLFLISAFLLVSCGNNADNQPAQQPETASERIIEPVEKVAFLDHDVEVISVVDVAIADTDELRAEGLMNVRRMRMNHGMIFIFEREEPLSFWMANTPLPLDLIFINSDFEIVRIQRDTRPYSTDQILSEYPALYVVEVNAGYAARFDIQEGMSIIFPFNPES